jgi:predicted ATPase
VTVVETDRVYSLLGDRNPMDLLNLPEMSDATYFAIATMLNKCLPAAFFTDIDLALLLAAKLVSLSISMEILPTLHMVTYTLAG